MSKLFYLISLLVFSFSASTASEWLYYKHYPWVYDNVSKDWLYLTGTDRKVVAYRSSTKEWEDFTVADINNTNLPSTQQIQLHESVTMDFILVQPGTFYMGEDDIAEPVHQVTLTQPFYLGKFEVTKLQYSPSYYLPDSGNVDDSSSRRSSTADDSGIDFNNLSSFNVPITDISYSQVLNYIADLNTNHESSLPENWEICLPTEAQWEYACRAGSTTSYSIGNSITIYDANWGENALIKDVGYYASNNWGFYDMHGNVQEWTGTNYGVYQETSIEDPTGPETGGQAIVRGGGYNNVDNEILKSAYRKIQDKALSSSTVGFRLSIQQKRD